MPTRGEIAATFEVIAGDFAATRKRPWPETIAFVRRLAANTRVLDLGCGNGRNIAAIRAKAHTVVGIDASRGLLGIAAANVGSRHLVRGDAVSLPFRDDSFNGVHTVATIHHMPTQHDRRQFMSEVSRVLEPDGLLLVSAWALEQPRFQDSEAQDRFVPWRRPDGSVVQRFYHLFRTGELRLLADDYGLAVERVWRDGGNYIVLATKQ